MSAPSCDVSDSTATGRADPVQATETRSDVDDPDEACATVAADVALARLDERLDVAISDADWIYAGYAYDGSYAAQISVQAVVDSDDGTVYQCPDPAFEFEAAADELPAEVDLTLESEDGDVVRKCSHEITLRQRTVYRD